MAKIIVAVLGAVLLSSSAAFAASYFVEKPKTTGVSPDDAATIMELVRTDVPRQAGATLAASASRADYVLRPKVMRLGKSYLVVLDKTDKAGNVLFSSELKAAEIEEFDTIAARLTRSVIAEVPAKNDAQLGEVTENESHSDNQRRDTTKFWLVGFGPFALFGLGSEGVSYGVTIGYDWDIGTKAAVKIFWDGVFNPNSASLNVFGLGGSYFFSEGDTAGLLGADFGYGTGHARSGDEASGFALGVGPGVRLFRTEKLNVELQARYGILLRTLDGSTPSSVGLHATLMF
jgi:hypothetical protein